MRREVQIIVTDTPPLNARRKHGAYVDEPDRISLQCAQQVERALVVVRVNVVSGLLRRFQVDRPGAVDDRQRLMRDNRASNGFLEAGKVAKISRDWMDEFSDRRRIARQEERQELILKDSVNALRSAERRSRSQNRINLAGKRAVVHLSQQLIKHMHADKSCASGNENVCFRHTFRPEHSALTRSSLRYTIKLFINLMKSLEFDLRVQQAFTASTKSKC